MKFSFFKPLLIITFFIFFSSFITPEKARENLFSENRYGISEEFSSSMYNGKVKIYELYDAGDNIGQSVWLYRTGKNVKARYFAYTQEDKDIYERYNDWKQGRNIIAYCAGPYTAQNYNVPQGITIDYGNVVNKNIDNLLDGLIIVEAVGGVRVADLEKSSSQCINLVSINQSLNPRNSSREKNMFIRWAENENATVFQTNLMYFKNQKKFGDVSDRASRRIFVLAIHNNQVVHIIFNIEKSVSLTNIAEKIYDYLSNKNNLRIIGILNFDTGMFDIFQVFNERGREMNGLSGTTSVRDAKNLMVYYYE